MNTARKYILIFIAALAMVSPALQCEQPQKALRPTPEDRIKKLEDRADADEKAASAAAMEKDYITRTQKQYEAYYQKVLNTQIWTLAILGVILTVVFVLVGRFSLNMIEERTKTATAGATVQMRNEYARAMAKEVQKLWDSNAADIKKLKETLTAQFAELQRDNQERSEFQMQFVHALAEGQGRRDDALVNLRNALRTYKTGKPRKLMETKIGATAVRSIFETVRRKSGEGYVEEARHELADPLYNELEEELALAALQSPWLTPLITERNPAPPEPPTPPAPEPAAEGRPVASIPQALPTDSELPLDDDCDSCRLLTT